MFNNTVMDGERYKQCYVSKPTRATLLCSWEGHFTELSSAWRSGEAALITALSLIKTKKKAK